MDSAGFAPATFSLRTKRATAAPRAPNRYYCVPKCFKFDLSYTFGVRTNVLGYLLLSLGIAIILFTFLVGYGFYQKVLTSSSITGSQQTYGNVSSEIGSLTSGLTQTAKEGTLLGINVLILFLFASIGYKIAMIGIHLIENKRVE